MDKGLYYDTVVDKEEVVAGLTKLTRQELIDKIVSLREQIESLKGTLSQEKYYQTIKPMMLSGARDAEKEAIEIGNRKYRNDQL